MTKNSNHRVKVSGVKLFHLREAEQLQRLLSAVGDPGNVFSLEELHGFLFGLVVTPEVVMPSEWISCIFGGEEPTFNSEKEIKAFMSLLLGAYKRFRESRSQRPLPLRQREKTQKMLRGYVK